MFVVMHEGRNKPWWKQDAWPGGRSGWSATLTKGWRKMISVDSGVKAVTVTSTHAGRMKAMPPPTCRVDRWVCTVRGEESVLGQEWADGERIGAPALPWRDRATRVSGGTAERAPGTAVFGRERTGIIEPLQRDGDGGRKTAVKMGRRGEFAREGGKKEMMAWCTKRNGSRKAQRAGAG